MSVGNIQNEEQLVGTISSEGQLKGRAGHDIGVSPTITHRKVEEGYEITIKDINGVRSFIVPEQLEKSKEPKRIYGTDANGKQKLYPLDDILLKFAIKQISEKGKILNITDSAEYNLLDFELDGKTEQRTIEGNQFFDISKVESGSTGSGTLTNKGDGTLFAELIYNSTNGSYDNKLSKLAPELQVGEEYTINAVTDGNPYIYLGGVNTTWDFGKSKIITQEMLDSVVYWYAKGPTTSATISDIMINKGTTALPYEPYVGGKASPNLDYPQEIVNVGVFNEDTERYEVDVKINGKNLWNKEYASDLNNWIFKDDNAYYCRIAVYVGKGNSVTISYPNPPLGLENLYSCVTLDDTYKSSNKTWIYNKSNNLLCQSTVTLKASECDYIYVWCLLDALRSGIFSQYISECMQIEYGDTKTDYEEHKEQIVTLTSDRPITKWDKLIERDGVYGWLFKSAIGEYDGSADEVWYKWGSGYAIYVDIPSSVANNISFAKAFCNRAIVKPYNDVFAGAKGFGIGTYEGKPIAILNPSLSTKEEWLSYIADNPIIWMYEAVEGVFVPLPQEEQEAIQNIMMNYPATIITNDAGAEMKVEYVADTKNYINKLIVN